jgi:ABC-type Zn uptake system ZnuABC Zn-binding protein ZnuA
VRTLLPAGADPHTYTPTPTDVQAVAESQLLIENGLGLEAWLHEVTQNAGGSRPTVVASAGLTPLAGFAEHDDEAHGDEAAASGDASDAAEERGADPHMWFDVQNAIGYVERIRDGLRQVDPAGASAYDANAAAYIAQLKQLDAEIVQQTQTIPAERRKLITNHDTFGYFAKRYGFEIVGAVFEGVSTEQEPSAQQIAALVSRIKSEGAPAIFTENTVNPRLAEQIAGEVGVNVVTSLYTDALGEPGSDGDTYIKMMRYDTQQIVNALK